MELQMKTKLCIIITLFFLFGTSLTKEEYHLIKRKDIYILINRNSPNVEYWESSRTKNNRVFINKHYTLKSYGSGNSVKVTFSYLDPQYDYSEFDMLKD